MALVHRQAQELTFRRISRRECSRVQREHSVLRADGRRRPNASLKRLGLRETVNRGSRMVWELVRGQLLRTANTRARFATALDIRTCLLTDKCSGRPRGMVSQNVAECIQLLLHLFVRRGPDITRSTVFRRETKVLATRAFCSVLCYDRSNCSCLSQYRSRSRTS